MSDRRRSPIVTWSCYGTFSTVSASGGVEQIDDNLRKHVSSRAKVFARHYKAVLPEPIEVDGNVAEVLSSLLSVVRETPYKLYLLIDEYDNFVNEVMSQDVGTYHALFGKDGPYRQLFKSVKDATEGQGLERVFVTGVSPVALNDLTSGFNNSEDVSLEPTLGGLCGFREQEVSELLERIAAEKSLAAHTIDQATEVIKTWYNGYRFSSGMDELVYNPTNVLYFLKSLYLHGTPPEELHDQNLRTDRGKLTFIARTAAGAGVIEKLTEGGDGSITVSKLEKSFSLDDLTTRLEKDPRAVASFLYYMGLLTQTDVPFRLRIPNLVVRKLFLDRLLEIFLPDAGDSSGAQEIAMEFFRDGDLEPLLSFFEGKLLPVLSNRDRGAAPKNTGQSGSGVNETVIKSLFLSILFADNYYRVDSEPELDKGYADLCLLVRPEMRRYRFFDLLFELKLVRRQTLKRKAQELRDMDDTELRQLPDVQKAFHEGRGQIRRYSRALVQREGELNLRAYVVVAIGLERFLGEEVAEKAE